MSFGTKGAEVKVNINKYIEPGNHVLKINDIVVKDATNTTSKKVVFEMETEPITENGFEGVEGAQGKVGRVGASIYLKTEEDQKKWIQSTLLKVAIALGVRDQIDEIEDNTFESYIAKAKEIIAGKYGKFLVGGEEYTKAGNGRIGINLILPRYDFAGDLKNEIKVATFDKANKNHYKVAQPVATTTNFEPVQAVSDLPFS